jgi:hypothetical protein
MPYRVDVPARQAGNRILGSLKGLQIRAQSSASAKPMPVSKRSVSRFSSEKDHKRRCISSTKGCMKKLAALAP